MTNPISKYSSIESQIGVDDNIPKELMAGPINHPPVESALANLPKLEFLLRKKRKAAPTSLLSSLLKRV